MLNRSQQSRGLPKQQKKKGLNSYLRQQAPSWSWNLNSLQTKLIKLLFFQSESKAAFMVFKEWLRVFSTMPNNITSYFWSINWILLSFSKFYLAFFGLLRIFLNHTLSFLKIIVELSCSSSYSWTNSLQLYFLYSGKRWFLNYLLSTSYEILNIYTIDSSNLELVILSI